MNLADNFAIVPDGDKMRELQKSIREFLQQNKVILLLLNYVSKCIISFFEGIMCTRS